MKLEQEIVNRIRELRTSKNMTQEQLADKIGLAVSYLGRIEWGKSANIQISTLEKIIEALDGDYPAFFSFGTTTNREAAVIHALSLSKNKDELLNIIERIVNIEQK